MSASAPGERVPLSIPKTRAGLIVIFSSAWLHERWPGSISFVMTSPQRGLQPDDAERGPVELLHLLFFGVRRVVGGDAIDRPVDQSVDATGHVSLPSQRAGSS